MTGADICETAGLPRRTVYAALRKLRGHGIVQQRQSLRDTRQTYFWLVTPPTPSFVQGDALDAGAPIRAE